MHFVCLCMFPFMSSKHESLVEQLVLNINCITTYNVQKSLYPVKCNWGDPANCHYILFLIKVSKVWSLSIKLRQIPSFFVLSNLSLGFIPMVISGDPALVSEYLYWKNDNNKNKYKPTKQKPK